MNKSLRGFGPRQAAQHSLCPTQSRLSPAQGVDALAHLLRGLIGAGAGGPAGPDAANADDEVSQHFDSRLPLDTGCG
jgi:hypothetical protein